VIECCKALVYAHSRDVIHRDVCPRNIVLSNEGDVKVSDFGLAKENAQIESSDPGVVKGNFSYLSPEAAWVLKCVCSLVRNIGVSGGGLSPGGCEMEVARITRRSSKTLNSLGTSIGAVRALKPCCNPPPQKAITMNDHALPQLPMVELAAVAGGSRLSDAYHSASGAVKDFGTDLYYAKQRLGGLGQITSAKGADDYKNTQRNLDRPGSTVKP
jgi:serine/threonine protein kinase